MRTAIFALFCLTLAAQNFPVQKQAALGKELAAQVRRNTTPVKSQAVQDYVSRLGAKVAADSPPGQFPLAFSVVNGLENPLNEPLVLPGGTIFVPLGLLAAANDEAELAGMLAQAIAHGPLFVRATSGQIPLYFWGSLSNQLAFPVSALTELRAMELAADKSAVAVVSGVGFDPAALLSYVEREQPASATVRPALSRLPPLAERSAALTQAIRELPPRATYIENTSDFTATKALVLAELTPPAQPRPRPSLKAQP